MARQTAQFRQLARLGAEARIAEIQEVLDALHVAFPDLATAEETTGSQIARAGSKNDQVSSAATAPRRRTLHVSAAQRKAAGKE